MTSSDTSTSYNMNVLALSDNAGSSVLLKLLISVVTVIITAIMAWLLVQQGYPSPQSLSVLFIIPVLITALWYGLWLSIVTTFLSVLAYDCILLPPYWDISLWKAENLTKSLVLIFVSVVTSALSGYTRQLIKESLQREHILSGLYALSQDMLGIGNLSDMRKAAETKLSSLLGCHVNILLKDESDHLDTPALYCIEHHVPTGEGTTYFSDSPYLYLPLMTKNLVVGLVRISKEGTKDFSSKILATLTAQTAIAIEKAILAESYEKQLRSKEKEKFLGTLLSSISHDFKTPLVTVIGALSALKDSKPIQEHPQYQEMVIGAFEEAQKLNRFITNLVEISRLDSGLETIRMEPVSFRDLLASALKTLRPVIGNQKFIIKADDRFPLLSVNRGLFELVFINLLDNAIKYGSHDGEINIISTVTEDAAIIDIDDDGNGIPVDERENIFHKFYRSNQGDRKIAGTGLGLYICRGIINTHGGSICAIEPHDGNGACIRINLPRERLIPITVEDEELEEVYK